MKGNIENDRKYMEMWTFKRGQSYNKLYSISKRETDDMLMIKVIIKNVKFEFYMLFLGQLN